MSYFEQTRSKMCTRRAELLRRMDQIEADLERCGVRQQRKPDPDDPAGLLLHECMGELRHELGLVESALRRIDGREYDCCMRCGGRIRGERLEREPYVANCRSCASSFSFECSEEAREHPSNLRRTMLSVLGILSDAIEICERKDARPGKLAATMTLLADLGRQLPERFRHEEHDGYLKDALAAAPRYNRRAGALRKQHSEFSKRIHDIVEQAESALDSSSAWADVRRNLRQLALDLLIHEEAESDLLESAFLDDLGGID